MTLKEISKKLLNHLKPIVKGNMPYLMLQESSESVDDTGFKPYMESIRDGQLYEELLKLMQDPEIDSMLKRINRERVDLALKKPRVKKITVEEKIKQVPVSFDAKLLLYQLHTVKIKKDNRIVSGQVDRNLF